MAGIVDGLAWWRAMFDVEAALARACASAGEIPAAAAEEVAACDPGLYDLAALVMRRRGRPSPVVPLAAALRERSNEHAHHGATSQDIVDTAMMLLAGGRSTRSSRTPRPRPRRRAWRRRTATRP